MSLGEGQVLGTREKVTTGQERIGVETGLGISVAPAGAKCQTEENGLGEQREACVCSGEEKWHTGFPSL